METMYVSERRLSFTGLRGVTSHKTQFFTVVAVKNLKSSTEVKSLPQDKDSNSSERLYVFVLCYE
jgi:hypothetical protein